MDIDTDMVIELIQERLLEPEKLSSNSVASYVVKAGDPMLDPALDFPKGARRPADADADADAERDT